MTLLTGTPTTFGGIGKLEFAPTNAPDDPSPTYVDITAYLRTEENPLSITRGRQTELDTIQPSQLTAVLENTDGRFTFGNTAGAYGSGWAPAKKVRYSETIGGKTVVLFTGYIEYPDIDNWQPIGYQEVALTCSDRLTRLSRGTPFLSTLGAYIKADPAASQLAALWPMTDDSNVQQNDISGSAVALPLVAKLLIQETNASGMATFLANRATPIFADDITPGLFTTIPGVTVTTAKSVYFQLSHSTALQTNPVATIAWWQYWDDTNSAGPQPIQMSGSLSVQFFRDPPTSGGAWKLFDGTTINVLPNPLPTLKWTFCAIHWTSTSTEFWQDANPPVVFPHAAHALNIIGVFVGQTFGGAIEYVQLYDGPLYTNTTHVAQFRAGLNGLEYQTTGQRINTILDYAGVPGDQRVIDPGVSFMQVATLAGEDPGSALADAVATERGRGFIDGLGRYIFHDRTRIYNV